MSIRFSKIEDLLDERHRFSWEVRRIDDQIWIYLKSVRRKLDKNEYEILKMRFHERKNLEEIGKFFGVTRERIRQKEAKAIEKLVEWIVDEWQDPRK